MIALAALLVVLVILGAVGWLIVMGWVAIIGAIRAGKP
jgi:hypothetical protein